MRKLVALMLVVTLAATLYGCSNNSTAIDVTEVLTSGRWKNEAGQTEMEFYKSGTGVMEIPGGIGTTFTWTELDNNCIRIESQPIMGVAGVFDFEVASEGNTYKLLAVSGKENYILID